MNYTTWWAVATMFPPKPMRCCVCRYRKQGVGCIALRPRLEFDSDAEATCSRFKEDRSL